MSLEVKIRCIRCGGSGIDSDGLSCEACNEEGVKVYANIDITDITDRINDLEDKLDDILELLQ